VVTSPPRQHRRVTTASANAAYDDAPDADDSRRRGAPPSDDATNANGHGGVAAAPHAAGGRPGTGAPRAVARILPRGFSAAASPDRLPIRGVNATAAAAGEERAAGYGDVKMYDNESFSFDEEDEGAFLEGTAAAAAAGSGAAAAGAAAAAAAADGGGHLVGIVLRSQLMVLLARRAFVVGPCTAGKYSC
jgi:hypothetical protein